MPALEVSLGYAPEPALGWDEPMAQTVSAQLPPEALGAEALFQDLGVRKAVALADEAETLRARVGVKKLHSGYHSA